MRQLATIQKINGVYPIEGKDRIVQYGINGWRIIDAKDKYQVGDKVVFCEIDSFIPNTIAPFLTKADKSPKVYEGIQGERLKTIRMGGALSQGLLLPMSTAIDAFVGSDFDEGQELCEVLFEGTDVTELLGIIKWEAPEPGIGSMSPGRSRGNFPVFLYKTDQPRVQNMHEDDIFRNNGYEVTEKLEGQSFTSYWFNGVFGVCSRNLDLKLDDEEPGQFVKTAIKYDIRAKLEAYCSANDVNIAIQGEQVGPGIEGNIYKLDSVKLFIYDVFDIDKQCYLSPSYARHIVSDMGLDYVPVIQTDAVLESKSHQGIRAELSMCVVRSKLADCLGEGLVFKSNRENSQFSFKAVSPFYLENDKKHTPWEKFAGKTGDVTSIMGE